ncbi:IS66 family transposase [Bradyrhizobium embrapense]|uniref:IS66 family transposase n=1 Tax=Bradyrhizobium embrapense TaxID=630921 RepID=UPI001FCDF7BD|nr:transposase [Bradyrhizobium embrapense]
MIKAACWALGSRKFFDLARLSKAPIAAESVNRVDVLFAIEREINGLIAKERLPARQESSRPLIVDLAMWLRGTARQALHEQRHDQRVQLLLEPLGCT